MSKFQETIATIRENRIKRIWEEPVVGLLARGLTKKVLAASAVVSSWIYLIALLLPGSLLDPNAQGVRATIEVVAIIVMGVSFLLMKKSVRRITSLPDTYLDELQIQNRDWAFSVGYLVVRRVGLALTLIFVSLGAVLSAWNYIYYCLHPLGNPYDSAVQNFFLNFDSYVNEVLSNSTFYSVGSVIVLLTYVAYSFPIILLTWQDAKYDDDVEAEEIAGWQLTLLRVSKSYFGKLWVILSGVLLSFACAVIPGLNLISVIWVYLGLFTIFFAVYVYGWGLVKLSYALRLLSSAKGATARESLPEVKVFLVLVSVIGISVGAAIASAFTWGLAAGAASSLVSYSVIAGIVLLILHVVAFVKLSSIAQRSLQE
jgi:hypothetical protein